MSLPAAAIPSPKKSLGQHFLFDRRLLARIVEEAGVEAGQAVIEIGPGPGGLTRALLEAGARVWAVEADARMVAHLEGQAWATPDLHVLACDALEVDYPALAAAAGGEVRLVANLPYNLSGPLLARLLEQRRAFVSLTVMLQREVAERLAAPPGTRVRGRLGVMAQCFCAVRPLFRVPPGAFRPPPKVESAVVRLDVLAAPVAPLEDEGTLWEAVRVGFGQRRKMLRNALAGLGLPVEPLLALAGLTGTERAEELTAEAWIAVANGAARLR
ncbi:MAG: ribosomal RNA small subunit methyltransferase A [Deltaproteobacteria bacterium]|nr:ribosomal RNA small subunit methyltransferase A [Deltaproteobacteria bacterium]